MIIYILYYLKYILNNMRFLFVRGYSIATEGDIL